MKPEELQQRIRKLRLTARRIIHTSGEGSFRTFFHGRGIEFAALREYVPGDDIRQIEWNTTARRGTPYVKTFVEERDLSVMLVVDLSSSMDIKKETVSQIVALLTFLAHDNDDRIGCLGFTNKVEFYIPPVRKSTQPERILHSLLQTQPRVRKTSIAQALSFLRRVLKKHSILFLISDFLDRQFEQHLVPLSQKHELVGLYVYDPQESSLPASAVIDCRDPESTKRILLDAYDVRTRQDYTAFFQQQKQLVLRAFGRAHADFLMLQASPTTDLKLIEFLRKRQTSRAPVLEG